MAQRKVLVGFCNADDDKARSLINRVISNEKDLTDVQHDIAVAIADDWYEAQDREIEGEDGD